MRALAFVVLLVAVMFPQVAAAVTRSAAQAQCTAAGAQVATTVPEMSGWTCTDVPNGSTPNPNDGHIACTFMYTFPNGGGTVGPNGCDNYYPTASSSYPYDEADVDCSGKPDMGANSVTGSFTACVDGCAYEAAGVSGCLGSGAGAYCFAPSWSPSGDSCTSGPGFNDNEHDPDDEVCAASQGYTHCVQPNGRHCVNTAAGTRMCWSPGETGSRMTQDGSVGASRVQAPATPSPPSNMANPTPGPSQSVTVNNTTYNSTVYTGTGNNGGQNDTGDGGVDNGVGGDDEGEGEEDEHGTPGQTGGDLYEDSDLTTEGVADAFIARVSAAPIVNATTDFFDISTGGGSCPVWVVPASDWTPVLVFDFFCMPELALYLDAAGIILLIVAAMYAFHIGIGN